MRKLRIVILAVPALAILAFGCSSGAPRESSSTAQAQLRTGGRVAPLGPDKGTDHGDDSLFTPSDFEAAAASHPEQASLVYFSRCRRAPFTSTSLYAPMSGSNADAIVNDTTQVFVDGTTCYQPQNEQNIAVNPKNANNVVTASNDYRAGFSAQVYASSDGGKTFTDVMLPGWDPATGASGLFTHVQAGGDPVLAFASDGTLYYSALVYDFSKANQTPSGVGVAVSHDGGLTWGAPVMVHYESTNNFFNDKEWIAAGPNGTLYVTWTRFAQGAHGAGYISSNIVLSVSHDHGATFSDPIQVSDAAHPFDQGSSPAVSPDGTLYVAYEGNQANDQTKDQIVVARSTDGGRTFTNTEIGRVYDDVGCYPLNLSQGRARLSFEQFRISSFPSLAIDPTTGSLAVVWADDQQNPGCGAGAPSFSGATNNQVKLVTSSDGVTWTAPRIITSGGDKAFPAAGANHGRVVVGYYTRDFSPTPNADDHTCGRAFLDTSDPAYPASAPVYIDLNPVCIDYAISSSTDGFASETRVSTQSSNPYLMFSGSFIGDYTGVAVDANGNALAVWTDGRGRPGIATDATTPNQDTVVGSGL